MAHLPQARLSFLMHIRTDGKVIVTFAIQNKKDRFVKKEARELLTKRLQEAMALGENTSLGQVFHVVSLDNYYGSTPKKDLFFPLLDMLREWRWQGAKVHDLLFEVFILLGELVYRSNRLRTMEESQLI